jgi:flagellar basal-body rod protein FlgF
MPYGLYISAQGADVQRARLEIISNNLANAETVGFKRQLALAQARHSEAIEQASDYPGSHSINDLSGGVMLRETRSDVTAGQVHGTGVDTDLAIDGDGFFMVQRSDGNQFLTRAGNFRFDSAGWLSTQQGYKVLNSAGAPIQVDLTAGPVSIQSSGQVMQRQGSELVPIGDVGIAAVEPQMRSVLKPEGENLFSTPRAPTQVAPAQRRLLVGSLEQSTVRPTMEMMNLIEASRAFEANVNMIRNQDQAIGSLLNRVLAQRS